MEFIILNKGSKKEVKSIGEGLKYMANDLKAMLAQNNDETGLSFSLLTLSVGESLTLDDENEDEIKVTRIK